MARVTVFVGNYGSGKTEVAINWALGLLPAAVALVDLDMVTPYFRVRDVRAELERRGLQVVVPGGALAAADMPVLPPGLVSVLAAGERRVVVDVGGDPVGARVLGSVAGLLPAGDYCVYYVVNPYRPFTGTVAGVKAALAAVQSAAGVRVDGLVANAHLGSATTPTLVARGSGLVAAAAVELGLPVSVVAVPAGLAPKLGPGVGGRLLALELFMRPPWDQERARGEEEGKHGGQGGLC